MMRKIYGGQHQGQPPKAKNVGEASLRYVDVTTTCVDAYETTVYVASQMPVVSFLAGLLLSFIW